MPCSCSTSRQWVFLAARWRGLTAAILTITSGVGVSASEQPDIAGGQPGRGGIGGGPQTPIAGGQPAMNGQYESPILNQAGNIQGAGQGWADPLYGIASGQNPVMQGLAGQANGSAALAQNQIDTLSRNLGQFYQQQLESTDQQQCYRGWRLRWEPSGRCTGRSNGSARQ